MKGKEREVPIRETFCNGLCDAQGGQKYLPHPGFFIQFGKLLLGCGSNGYSPGAFLAGKLQEVIKFSYIY